MSDRRRLFIHSLLERRVPAQAREWMARLAADSFSLDSFRLAFSTAGRLLGAAPLALAPNLTLTDDENERSRALGLSVIAGASLDEIGRIALLLQAAATGADMQPLVARAFRRGDNGERRAVLKALPLLPNPTEHLAIAVEACRTHVISVFEGIACENPYPAAHFPVDAFNQLVLKALFVGVPLDRIVGISERRNPELDLMMKNFASERRAAGRPVPADVDSLLAKGESA